MSESSPHLNGHTPPLPSGGGLGALLTTSTNGADMRMMGRGLREGWMLPWKLRPGLADSLPNRMADLVESDDERISVRAATVLVQMAKYNLELVEAVDNAGRLNDGDATERIEIVYRKPERQVIDE